MWDEEPSPLTTTGRLRRLAMSPLSPEDPLDVEATTPVPPPVPVLPDSEAALLPSAGRRFSASAEPGEVVSAAPRRSAATAGSPDSAGDPILPPVVRPTAPPSVTVNVPTLPPPPRVAQAGTGPGLTHFSKYPQSVPTAPTAPPDAPSLTPAAPIAAPEPAAVPKAGRGRKAKPPKPAKEKAPRPVREKRSRTEVATTGADPAARPRSARPAITIIAAVAAVVVLVAAAVWALTLRSNAPSGGPSSTGTAVALDPLLTVADLAGLGGVTWADPPASSDGVRPICLSETADGLPQAQRTDPRKIGASSSATDAVIQVVDTYPDEATASQAYAARLAQAGTCADTVALITGANTIDGLADSADLLRLTVQDESDQFHSLLLTRTGRTVNLIDVATSAAVPAPEIATVAAKPLSRQCGGGVGTCPGSIQVAAGPPPPGNPYGWLVAADLPRITPGAGRWGPTDPQTVLDVVGSQCEAMNLKTVSGTQSVGQRTFLLADDASAPKGFGVDQVVYTFADSAAAQNLAKKLDTNLGDCPDRAPTASVTQGPAVKGTGALKAKITGSTFMVTQKTETNTVVFRVAVLTVGERLVYLLANPSTSFDFSDEDWSRLAVRAGQRASQST